ncbi:MAG: hypothetical protein JWO10_1182, partial [Microbacteriaceae bacterium]|nr:hypothetical protein [Microbacteriaceae bacterium]
TANADLAAGSDRVLVIVPAHDVSHDRDTFPSSQFEALHAAKVRVIYADEDSLAAFGANPLDPTVRRTAAIAGREQGRRVGASLAGFWS